MTYLQSSKVNNAVHIGVRSEDFVKGRFIRDIDVVVGRASTSQQFDAADDRFGRVVLIVNDDNLVASLNEGHCGEGANIPRSTVLESEMLRSR